MPLKVLINKKNGIIYFDYYLHKGGEIMAKVTKDMMVAQVLQMDRETAPVFMKYGLHCLG